MENRIGVLIKNELEGIFDNSETSGICNFCGKKFGNITHLNMHIEKVHSLSNGESDTTVTENINSLILEVASSEELPKYSCQYCDKTFSSTVVCRNHELVHMYTKECPYCPKKFFQDSHLKFHLRLHGINEFEVKLNTNKSTGVPKTIFRQEQVSPVNEEKILEKGEIPKLLGKDGNEISVIQLDDCKNKVKKRRMEIEDIIEDLSNENDSDNKPESVIEETLDQEDESNKSDSGEELKPEIDPSYSSCCSKMFKDLTEFLLHVEENHIERFRHTVKELLPLLQATIQDIKEEDQTSSKDMVLVVPWY